MFFSRALHWLFNPFLPTMPVQEGEKPRAMVEGTNRASLSTRPTRSVGTRLFLYILMAAFMGLGGMSYLFYERLETEAIQEMRGRLSTQVALVERELAEAKRSMETISVAVGALHDAQVRDPQAYEGVLSKLFQQRSHLTMALNFGQTVHAIVPRKETYWPYLTLDRPGTDQPGERLALADQMLRHSDVCQVDPDCLQQPYFQMPVQAGHAVWLAPYRWGGITMTSITAPIWDAQKALLGVAGLDIDVSALGTEVVAPSDWAGGYFVIIGPQGKLISYPPDQTQANQLLSYTQIPELKSLWSGFPPQQSGVIRRGSHYYAFAPVKDTRWTILAVVPKQVVLGPVWRITLSSLAWATVILAAAAILFVRWMNQRLAPIVAECQAILETDLQRSASQEQADLARPSPYLGSTEPMDELGVLSYTFDHMTKLRQCSIDELEQRVQERTLALEESRDLANAANRAKSEFLAQMSHELRTPLNGILGYAQILQHSAVLPSNHRSGVEIIQRSGQHLLMLINDILDIAKIETQHLELHPTSFSLTRFIQDISQSISLQAKTKGLAFELYQGEGLPNGVIADETRLRQVLFNLLSNAVKFTPQGTVELNVVALPSVSQEGGEPSTCVLTFAVSDSGIGIAPDQLERIFNPFEQVRQSQFDAEGTGLGLAISQQIVQNMGGELSVDSCLGVGSQFSFTLSLLLSSNIAAAPSSAQVLNVRGYEGQRRRILIVDDHPDNRRVILDFLRPLGFELCEAENGLVAFQQMEQQKVDLVITDILMPEMGGLALIKQLREDESDSAVPILVSSASVFETDQQESLEAGASAFLAKPVDYTALLEQLQTLLDLRWIETGAPVLSIPKQANLSQELIYPDGETVQRLLRLANSGLINQLQTQLEELKQQSELEAFIQQALTLAEGFELKALQSLLKQALPEISDLQRPGKALKLDL